MPLFGLAELLSVVTNGLSSVASHVKAVNKPLHGWISMGVGCRLAYVPSANPWAMSTSVSRFSYWALESTSRLPVSVDR